MTKHITWMLVALATAAAIGVSACQPKGDSKESMSQSNTSSTEQQPMSSSSSDTMHQSSGDNASGGKDGMSK